jgi:hypothetical protein
VQRGEGAAENTRIVKRSRSMDEKPQYLCDRCNNERLGRVERERLKPLVEPMMLYGTPRSLSSDDQRTIAMWAFKTLIVHNHAYSKPPFLYSRTERKRFIATLVPPEKNFRVWLARLDVPGRTGQVTGLPLVPNSTATREYKHLWCYTLTVSVGQFMFQIHAIRPGDSRRGDFTRLFPDVDARWQRKVIQIWPWATHVEAAWPPPENVRNTELDEFCSRWGGMLSAGLADIALQ